MEIHEKCRENGLKTVEVDGGKVESKEQKVRRGEGEDLEDGTASLSLRIKKGLYTNTKKTKG